MFKRGGFLKNNFFITLVTIVLTVPLYTMNPVMKKHAIEYTIRRAKLSDRDNLKSLYIKVASIPGKLVRTADEITDQYIDNMLKQALERGLIFVAEYQGKIIGSVSQYKPNIKILSHVLDEASIAVDPEHQGIGIGTALYSALLSEVKDHHSDILRVDLKVRVSNPAIHLYEKLGFKKEGEFKNLIRGINGKLESVIAMTWFNPNFKDEIKEI